MIIRRPFQVAEKRTDQQEKIEQLFHWLHKDTELNAEIARPSLNQSGDWLSEGGQGRNNCRDGYCYD